MSVFPGSVDYNDNTLTVDSVLNNPHLIEQRISSIAEEQSIIGDLFTSGSAPEGGAVIYSRATRDNLFPEGDATARQPGDEYGVINPTRPEDKLAKVEDYGGKFFVTDEARQRNRAVDFDNSVTQLTNLLTRQLNRRAVSVVQAVQDEAAGDLHQIVAAAKWTETLATGPQATLTNPRELPGADLSRLIAQAEKDRLGVTFSTLLISPAARAELRTVYGPDLAPLLADLGLSLKVSMDVPAEQAYLVDPGKFGFISWEHPITVKTWRDEHRSGEWVQAFAKPSMGATTPGALAIIRGIL